MNSIFNNYCARATLIDLQITNHNARPAFTTLASLVYPASRATKVNTQDISRMFQKKQCRTLVAVAYAFRHDVSSIDACCYYLEWYIISDIPTQAHSSSDAPFLICVKCKATVEIDKLDDLQMKI